MAIAEPIAPLSHEPPAARPMVGILLRLSATIVLATMFALVKLAADLGVHVVESVFWRQLAGLPVALVFLWWNGDLMAIRTDRPVAHGIRMLLGIGAMLLNFSAMVLLDMAEATTFGFAAQIFGTILAALLLREPTGRYRWAAVLIGFAGVIVALQPGGSSVSLLGATVALSGAAVTAAVIVQIRQMTRSEAPAAIVFWFSLTSMLPLGIALPFFNKAHTAEAWAAIAGLSVAGAIAQLLLTASLRHASVATTMTIDYSMLIWSALAGYLVFSEVPATSIWMGAPLIVGAGLFIAWRERYLAQQRIKAAPVYRAG
ncbi:MAG: DMT family transporter [Sphingorhabdus sp.]